MPDCKSCKETRQNVEPVPYIAHESAMARMERTIKKLWILLILIISLLVVTNGAWLWYESQFVEEDWTYEATTDNGGTAIANGEGEIYYYGDGENHEKDPNP